MAAVRYTAIRWAREVPTLLHRGRVDRLGHHLLLLLATYAKNDGSDMYASVTSLAKDAHAPERDVEAALARLEKAGLIAPAHGSNGAPGWSLNLGVRPDVDNVAEAREARRRASTKARTRKWRERRKATGDAEVGRHVTSDLTVTNEPVTHDLTVTDGSVTQEFGVRDAEVVRHNDDVTHQCDAGDAQVAVTNGHLPAETALNSLELPKELTPKDELPADADASGANEPALIAVTPVPKAAKPSARTRYSYTPAFEAAWVAYGKRGDKPESFAEWQKAIKRADPSVITGAIEPFVRSTPDIQYRKHFQRWLKNDCWESAVVPARPVNGHQPYRDRDRTDADYQRGWA